MFVYQTRPFEGSKSNRTVERFFRVSERWARDRPGTVVVIACALLFGAISKVTTMVPAAAFIATIAVLAWNFGEEARAEEPRWVNRLSLASTGVLYLGLGHCLGLIVLPLVAAAYVLTKPS